MQAPVDILILSNGPGELSTWVQPVVKALRQQLGEDRDRVRISLVLSPCANASGQEVAIARRYPEIDRVQAAEYFFPFLVWGKTQEPWDWRKYGVVLFLGGDQFFPVIIGKRLGYRTVVYAEWEARWHGLIDRFGVMNPETAARIAPQYAHKVTVVGDLMAEAGRWQRNHLDNTSSLKIGLLPGSKPMKLSLGVPLTLAIAEQIHATYPNIEFVIPVAPSLDLQILANYANPQHNPAIQSLNWTGGDLVLPDPASAALPYLKTPDGVKVFLCQTFPAYDVLAECTLCLTTIGANTAELGSLGVPMLVLVPTQQMDLMKAWDGIPGILANLPGVGSAFARVINWMAFWMTLRQKRLLAWPNIWAKEEIVPELIGRLQPEEIANRVIHYLKNPAELQQIRDRLRAVRGQPGAAQKLVQMVREELEKQLIP